MGRSRQVAFWLCLVEIGEVKWKRGIYIGGFGDVCYDATSNSLYHNPGSFRVLARLRPEKPPDHWTVQFISLILHRNYHIRLAVVHIYQVLSQSYSQLSSALPPL